MIKKLLYIKILKNFIFNLIKSIKNDEIIIFAQALTFTTLITIIPLCGFIISLAKTFIPQEKIIDQAIFWLTQYLTPKAIEKIVNLLIELIQKLKEFPLGKFSIIAYFITSSALFFQLEDSLNKIFKSTKRRSFLQRISFYWFCITITPFLLFLPFSFHSFLLTKFIALLIIVGLIFVFFLIYIYFPVRKIPQKEAFIGALFSGISWSIVSYLYGFYVKHAIFYSAIYGSLASIPLFLIWIFVNWLLFLLGAELAVFIEKKGWKNYINIPTNLLKLCVLYALTENFLKNKITSLKELSQKIGFPLTTLEPILEQLEKEKLIIISEKNYIALIKSPEKITLASCLDINLHNFNVSHLYLKNIFKKLTDKYPQIFNTNLKEFIES